ncbi:phosphatidylserine/phosphatidylglycerophosphate/cardiolipin synthase family protein [Streptosporangium sp. NPDC000509]|uniref:phospholipase D-like domain-containing protein n=1 Tax=Streptosporangium sp. NPDC000509 TaxID=3366186 RepID=UPI0036787F07
MTDQIDLGELTFDEGFFLLRNARRTHGSYSPGEDAPGGYRHVFTYAGSRKTIKEAALELIGRARDKVFVASYLLGEKDLLEALYAAAHRLRGGVYVISELSGQSLRRRLAELEDERDPDDAARIQRKHFAELTRRGIAVRGHPNCHAKFVVVDDRFALISSANLDTNGLNSIGENGVVIDEPAEVDRIARFFVRLWHSCSYEMPPGSATYSVQRREPEPSSCRVPLPEKPPGPGVIWTHDDERFILDHLHDVIDQARNSVLLATFSLNGLVDRPELLLGPLERAMRRRPLQVDLLCRGRNNMAAHRADATALADLGVRVHADSRNHAKGVIADGGKGALFSANFDAAHGLLDGVETGVRLDGQTALAEAVRYFTHAMAEADLSFARRPTQKEMNDRLAAGWRKPWPLETTLGIDCAESVWREFSAAVRKPPVLYTRERGGRLLLHAGEAVWELSQPRDRKTWRLAPLPEETSPGAGALLGNWLSRPRTRGTSDPEARGICPAVLERR